MSRTVPLDIQLEIIKRLPVKSLIRFISVCKAWKSLIKCPEFVAGYRVLPTQSEHLMIRYVVDRQEADKEKFVCFVDDETFPQQKFVPTVPPILQIIDESQIIGSSGGLLCLDGYFQEPDNSKTHMAVLWNPSIRKSIAVDVPDDVVHWPFNYVIGFGVCPDTKDPKLVKITYICDVTKMESISCIPCQVIVFTLSSGEWTPSSSNQLPRKSIQFTCNQTVIGQFIYWRAYDGSDVDGERRNLIMSFNMSSKEFREVDLPDSLARKSGMYISRLRESLVLLHYSRETSNKQVCDVWMMEHGDSKAFTKIFTINPPNASVSWTLGFRKSGQPIVEMQDNLQDFVAPCALVVYEPCSMHIMDLGIRGHRWSFSGSSYMESLHLLDHDDHGHIVRYGAVKSGGPIIFAEQVHI